MAKIKAINLCKIARTLRGFLYCPPFPNLSHLHISTLANSRPEALVCEYLNFSQQLSRIFRCPSKMNIGYHKKLVGLVNDDRYGRGVEHVGRRRKTIVELAERAESMRCLKEAKEDLAAADTSAATYLSCCHQPILLSPNHPAAASSPVISLSHHHLPGPVILLLCHHLDQTKRSLPICNLPNPNQFIVCLADVIFV